MTGEPKSAQSIRLEEAVEWHARLAAPDADEATWTTFMHWLEADPANRLAFDRIEDVEGVVEGVRDAGGVSQSPIALADFARRPAVAGSHVARAAPWLAGALLAATFLLVVNMPGREPSANLFETGVGQTKTIALADGTKIDLNTNTAISVAALRHVYLVRGEALFHVTHDTAHPFTITVGDQNVRDIGTIFNILYEKNRTTVAVAEGRVGVEPVSAQPGSVPIVLSAGDELVREHGVTVVTRVAPDTVAAWRQGYLVYREAPLSKVVDDLNRYFPSPIVLASAEVGAQKFSGVLKVDNEDAVLRRIAKFLPIAVERGEGNKITLRMSTYRR